MTTEGKIALTCAALFVGLVALEVRSTLGNAEQRGAYKAETKQLDTSNAALRAHAAKVDTVHVRDSVRYVVRQARYDTLYVRDTVTVHDTLYVRKDLADSTLRACSDVFLSCERKVAVRDSIIANRDERITLSDRMAADIRRQSTRDKLVWAIVGAASGRLSCAVR